MGLGQTATELCAREGAKISSPMSMTHNVIQIKLNEIDTRAYRPWAFICAVGTRG